MKKLSIIFCLGILLIIGSFILHYFLSHNQKELVVKKADFMDIQFNNLQPEEGSFMIGSDGYVSFNDEGEFYKYAYVYDEENAEITYTDYTGEVSIHVLHFDKEKKYLFVSRECNGNVSLAFYTVPFFRIEDILMPKEGSVETTIQNSFTQYVLHSDNTYTQNHGDSLAFYSSACLTNTDYCDFLLLYSPSSPDSISMIFMKYQENWVSVRN